MKYFDSSRLSLEVEVIAPSGRRGNKGAVETEGAATCRVEQVHYLVQMSHLAVRCAAQVLVGSIGCGANLDSRHSCPRSS